MAQGPADTLLFMHIPKTAGTSLRHLLERMYRGRDSAYLYDPNDMRGAIHPRDFAAMPEEDRARLALVVGHFQFGIHEWIPRTATYLTMVRDPIDRLISLYYHYKNSAVTNEASGAFRHRATIEEQGLTFERFVFGGLTLQTDNEMVRQVSGRWAKFGECTQELLDQALEHVESQFAGVMVYERMPESMDLLARVTGRPVDRLGRSNVSRARVTPDQIAPDVRERVLEFNRYDSELYRRAVARMDRTPRGPASGA